MSIATKTGDRGETRLVGNVKVSKASLRVEAYGTVDELGACLGLARALAGDEQANATVRRIQKELFTVGGALANPRAAESGVSGEMTDRLTTEVHALEAVDGILLDWAIAGETPGSAAFDVARTVCRRAERAVVRLQEAGETVDPAIVVYLNRLSDLLWLIGRWLEVQAGVDSALRGPSEGGPRWSRAW